MGKKSFTGNPAMAFISQESIDRAEGKTSSKKQTENNLATNLHQKSELHEETARKQRGNSELRPRERRSHRLQVLLTPSLYDSIKSVADEEGIKLNELINLVLQDFIEKR